MKDKEEKKEEKKQEFILMCVDFSDTDDVFPKLIGGFGSLEDAQMAMEEDVYSYARSGEHDYKTIVIQEGRAEVWFDSVKETGGVWSIEAI